MNHLQGLLAPVFSTLLCLTAATTAVAQDYDANPGFAPAAVTRGPYLQMQTDDGITVRWRTDLATDSVVRYGATPGSLDQSVTVTGTRTEHEVALTGTFKVNGMECRPSFELLKEHVKKYTPEYVAKITYVPAKTISRIAREFGEAAEIGSTVTIETEELEDEDEEDPSFRMEMAPRARARIQHRSRHWSHGVQFGRAFGVSLAVVFVLAIVVLIVG